MSTGKRERRNVAMGGKRLEALNQVRRQTASSLDDTYAFINSYCKIRLKGAGADVIMQPSESQQIRRAVIKALREKYKESKVIDNKSRQVGFTTDTALIEGVEAYSEDHTHVLVMAQEDSTIEQILQIHDLWYDSLPESLKLPLKHNNRELIQWHHSLSQVIVANPKSRPSGRGKTIHKSHYSEAAFYPNLKDTLEAWRGAMAKVSDGYHKRIEVLDSTANGTGNYYYELWTESWNTRGKSKYQPSDTGWFALFSEWFRDSANRLPFESDRHKAIWVNDELRHLPFFRERMKKYGWSEEQAHWLWWQWQFEFKKNYQILCQEFPCSQAEAFIASGTPIFPMDLALKYKAATRPGKRYCVHDPYFQSLGHLSSGAHLEPNKQTYLEVWEEPSPQRRYVVVGDAGEGVHGGGDYSDIQVYCVETRNLCAELHGWIRATPMAGMMMSLGYIYNTAWLAPENRFYGAAVVDGIRAAKYPRLWRNRKLKGPRWEVTDKLGFLTDSTSRPLMINKAVEVFIDKAGASDDGVDGHFLPSEPLIDEILKFTIQGASGKAQAEGSAKDDRVITYCIGQQVIDQLLNRPPDSRVVAVAEPAKVSNERKRILTPRQTVRGLLKRMNLTGRLEYGEETRRRVFGDYR